MEPDQTEIAIDRQCYLLDLSRSSYYYRSRRDDDYNHLLMRLIDEQYTKTPFYGVISMRYELIRMGHAVSEKRIRRLMRLMDLAAIYPKPRLSKATPEHKIYPYLLRGMAINRCNQAWCADISVPQKAA